MRNQKIMNYFIKKQWSDIEIHTFIKINKLFLVFNLLFSIIIYLSSGSLYLSLLINTIFSLISIHSYKGSTIKTVYFCILHSLLKREVRQESEIIINNELNKVISSNSEKEDLIPLNKTSYIKKNISDKQSIVSFINERDIRNNLINWSSFLPLNRLNLDYKKQLIAMDRMPKKINCPVSKEDIELKFSLYSEKDIYRIFSSYYNFEDYLYCLESSFSEAFPVSKNIKELRDLIMDINEPDYDLEKSFPWISQLSDDFKIIKNKRELYDWAELMQNCLKSYDEKLKSKKSIILGYSKEGTEPEVIIEVIPTKGIVTEIKGYKNQYLFKSEELLIKKEILRSFKQFN